MGAPLAPIRPGKRAMFAGRTGSGKSTVACWWLNRSPGHWLILNPKWTAAFNGLPDSNVVDSLDLNKIEKSLEKYRFTIVNPQSSQSSPDVLDALIMWLHESFTDIGLCVDELYAIHKNGIAGEGLIGWLTRGRELRQSFLGLTQRPAWLSKFIFSESDFVGGMSLALEADRKRMYEITGRQQFMEKLPPREWLWYDVEADHLRKFGPVPLIKKSV